VDRDLSHDEIVALLGAYALDAVDADEAAAIAAHLEECPRCAAEVAEHREVAGLIANAGVDAPPELWEQISARVGAAGARASGRVVLPPGAPSSPSRRSLATGAAPRRTPAGDRARRAWWGVVGGAAAAAVAVIAVLGVQVSHLDGRVGQLTAAGERSGMAQAVQAALLDPSARTVTLTSASASDAQVAGTRALVLVILPNGSAYAVNTGLRALAADRTYQLWGSEGGRLVSLGLLGADPGDVAVNVGAAGVRVTYAVTDEASGGAVQPTGMPVASSATRA
jgi:anti-sigma factor RsiW